VSVIERCALARDEHEHRHAKTRTLPHCAAQVGVWLPSHDALDVLGPRPSSPTSASPRTPAGSSARATAVRIATWGIGQAGAGLRNPAARGSQAGLAIERSRHRSDGSAENRPTRPLQLDDHLTDDGGLDAVGWFYAGRQQAFFKECRCGSFEYDTRASRGRLVRVGMATTNG
jgi:hypothetical protein